jgi:glyoxylase-like metal-dependent hydrolase (beta-lactamase superfamily II)/ferredoxin
MASVAQRLPENVPGEFYVDRTCIDCDTCRRIAPEVFAEGDGCSYVARQPDRTGSSLESALKALVACPTGSIGTVSRIDARPGIDAYPEKIDGDVFFCGYTSPSSFGAWSYLIRRPEGNVLVDSPRAAGPLLSRIEALGGVETMILTHRDDVADHASFHKRFGCRRVIHERDVSGETRAAELQLSGDEPISLAEGLTVIPTPGHTRGHQVILWQDRYLFTGDHLAGSHRRGGLTAFRGACWYSWKEQTRSMERLLDDRFTWVLPGHGERFHTETPEAMRRELARCIRWMKTG